MTPPPRVSMHPFIPSPKGEGTGSELGNFQIDTN